MSDKPLKVGLDLDGVILYNPARIVRPIVYFIKKFILHKKRFQFYVPKSPLEKLLWHIFHMSSIFVAPGFEEIAQLAKDKKIELYIITARYSFLKNDFERWLDKIDAKQYLSGWFYNKDDEQPYAFKERMIKHLDLDVFVEDNWDIVKHITTLGKPKKSITVYWLYNILDKGISYEFKKPTLKHVAKALQPKRKTRVLIATDYFYPHWTGIAKAMYNLIKELRNTIDFSVLTVRFDNKLKYYEKVEGASVYRTDYAFPLSRSKYSLSMIWKAITLIPSHDVVLINSPCSNILLLALLTKLYGKKLVIFHQGDLILPRGLKNRVIEYIFDVCTYIGFALAHKVSTYTQDYAIQSRVIKPFMDKFTPLLMPFYCDKPTTIPPALKPLEKLKEQGHTLYGFAGRFVEEKGFDTLFDAITLLDTDMQNARFVYAGSTDIPYENFYADNLPKLEAVKDRVINLGLLSEEDLNAFYSLIDFIVIPSRSDCFPLVQAEACKAGKPSIVTDIPGARVIVKTTGFGVICRQDDPKDLALKLKQAAHTRKELMKKYDDVLNLLDNSANAEKIRAYLED
ncbi:MAG: hypothetical protein RI947_952 [Candidatus Parcubacteria bacterium]|jgi:glycosyltransferase involved in cell wall biosynthesis